MCSHSAASTIPPQNHSRLLCSGLACIPLGCSVRAFGKNGSRRVRQNKLTAQRSNLCPAPLLQAVRNVRGMGAWWFAPPVPW